MAICELVFASYVPISPWAAELCLRARQLGLSGEAAAAEQILAERKHQASQDVTAAASTGTAATYQAAVVTATTAAVEVAVLSGAEATFSARCAEAAEALSMAAESGGWVMFASAREEAAVLQQDIQDAEIVMSQRRRTVSAAVSTALDSCIQALPLKQGLFCLTGKHVHEHQHPNSQALLLGCVECSRLTEAPDSHTTKARPLQGPVTGLFHGNTDSSLQTHSHSLAQRIIAAITQTISTISLATDKPGWEVAIAALEDATSPAKAAAAVWGRSTQSSPAAAFAAALTDARQLGLLQTVELALQTLLAQAQLQLQTQQAVVAEFDLPAQEHPQELCTKAWQHPMSMQQVMTQVASCTTPTAAAAEAHHEVPAEAVASVRSNCWDSCSAETEVEELGSQLVAELQAGEHLCPG